jgi:hypothetical protein
MPYYQGDFYQGDFYQEQGDPGLFGFLGKAIGTAAGFIPGVGGIAGRAISAITKGRPAIQRTGSVLGGIVRKHPVLSAAGAAGAIGMMGAGAGHMLGGGAACPKGFHPCKSRHGCRKGPCVRNRHMRVTNPRALRRSLRRATGFAKLAMRTIHLVHPKKKARFGGWRRKRK